MLRFALFFLLLATCPALAADAGYCVNQCGNRCYNKSPSCFSACTSSCMSGAPRSGGGTGPGPASPRWGAVAGEAPPGGSYGVSNSWGSEAQARTAAMTYCRKYASGYPCGVLMTFPAPLCVGLATAWNGDASLGLFVHTDRSRQGAEQAVVNDCRVTAPAGARCELRERATCATD